MLSKNQCKELGRASTVIAGNASKLGFSVKTSGPTNSALLLLQDGRVFIWTCDDASGNSWSPKLLHKFNDVVWHVSWSITANILAVSGGDNKVSTAASAFTLACAIFRRAGMRQLSLYSHFCCLNQDC